ncbi:hypothetical protein [Riemerella columbina]|uniref:hypothetical protein n=1 Tax=Riemerella columbina TaxID=103810 RepID=UPI00037E179F|nr:hypothetical protein [Riemerella columbina]
MNKIIKTFLFLISTFNFAQSVQYVGKEDIRAIARKSERTLLKTFAIWCEPCRMNIKNYTDIEHQFKNTQLYYVLIETEGSKRLQPTIDYLIDKYPKVKILVLKDEDFGKGVRRKNRNFLKAFNYNNQTIDEGIGKDIVLDKGANVLTVTSWQDRLSDETWQDEIGILRRKVFPLLQ